MPHQAAWWWQQGHQSHLGPHVNHLITPGTPHSFQTFCDRYSPKTDCHVHKPPGAKHYKLLHLLVMGPCQRELCMAFDPISHHRRVQFPSGMQPLEMHMRMLGLLGPWLLTFCRKHYISQGTSCDSTHGHPVASGCHPWLYLESQGA